MNPIFNGGKPIEILLVEDNADEAELTMTSLKDGRVRNRIHWVEDGEDALAFLRRRGPRSPRGQAKGAGPTRNAGAAGEAALGIPAGAAAGAGPGARVEKLIRGRGQTLGPSTCLRFARNASRNLAQGFGNRF